MIYGRLLVMTPPPGARKSFCLVDGDALNNVESAQKQTRTFPTRNREVVNLSGLAEQRVSITVWKTVGVASNRKQMIAAGVVNSM